MTDSTFANSDVVVWVMAWHYYTRDGSKDILILEIQGVFSD
jgi:hypothetical protein